jgi:hypothetical protein
MACCISKAKNVCGLCRHISILDLWASFLHSQSEHEVDLMILQFTISNYFLPVGAYCKVAAIPSTNAAMPTAPGSGGKDSPPT